jgi:hypothetical protein
VSLKPFARCGFDFLPAHPASVDGDFAVTIFIAGAQVNLRFSFLAYPFTGPNKPGPMVGRYGT